MTDRLTGKVALISGGARGQGAATGRLFAEEGAKVVLGDVLVDGAKQVAAEIGDAAAAVDLDVTDEPSWRSAIASAEQRFGPVNVLINNAGILRLSALADTAADDYMTVVKVNQLGVFLGMKSVLASMERAGGGSIINVSSIEGLQGSAGVIAYASTKFAVRGMTKSAAVELGRRGIRVNSIHPGGVDTAMLRIEGMEDFDIRPVFKRVPLGRVGEPEEVAALNVFLASDESSYCTGAEFVIDGGATAGIALTAGVTHK